MLQTNLHTNVQFRKKTGILLFLMLFLFVQSGVWAQPQAGNKLIAEDISPVVETNPVVETAPIIKIEREPSKDFGFEKLDVQKSNIKTKKYNYKAGEIDRSFMVNNPFDMEDLSNPFNLPRKGSNIRRDFKKKESQDIEKFFNSLFEYKVTQKKTVVNKKPEVVAPYWILFSMLGMLSFFTYMLVSYKGEIKKTMQVFGSSTSAGQQYRDQKNIFTPYSLFSYSLFVLAMGHFVFVAGNLWLSSKELEPNWSFQNLFLSILGISGIFFLKHNQVRIIGSIFPFKQQLDYYNFIISNSNKVMAFVFTPLLFLLVYSPDPVKFFTLYTALSLVGLSYLYRYFRSAIAASDIILVNKFHFFIYLCSVELAPVLLLLKLLSII